MVTSSRGTEGQAGYRSGLGAELSKVITDWTNLPHSFQHREVEETYQACFMHSISTIPAKQMWRCPIIGACYRRHGKVLQ